MSKRLSSAWTVLFFNTIIEFPCRQIHRASEIFLTLLAAVMQTLLDRRLWLILAATTTATSIPFAEGATIDELTTTGAQVYRGHLQLSSFRGAIASPPCQFLLYCMLWLLCRGLVSTSRVPTCRQEDSQFCRSYLRCRFGSRCEGRRVGQRRQPRRRKGRASNNNHHYCRRMGYGISLMPWLWLLGRVHCFQTTIISVHCFQLAFSCLAAMLHAIVMCIVLYVIIALIDLRSDNGLAFTPTHRDVGGRVSSDHYSDNVLAPTPTHRDVGGRVSSSASVQRDYWTTYSAAGPAQVCAPGDSTQEEPHCTSSSAKALWA